MYRFYKEEIRDLLSLVSFVRWTQMNGIEERHVIKDLIDADNLYLCRNKFPDEECQNIVTGFYFRAVHPKDGTGIAFDYYFSIEEPIVYI